MKLSTQLSYAAGFRDAARQVPLLEKAGLDIVWVPETYSFDAPSAMGYLAAITETVEIASGVVPIFSRTPTLLAMTAAGLDALSEGRSILGLGASGPQIIEGWHGMPFDRPLARLREVVEICRKVWRREGPVTNDGPLYPLPLPEGSGTGLGKPLKIINHPVRDQIPIYLASLSERSVELAAEIANGWIPLMVLPEKMKDAFASSLDAGYAKRPASLGPLEICAGGFAFIGQQDEAKELLDRFARPMTALNIGGMGARGKNFPNELVRRFGYEAEAIAVQELFLAGKKAEAMAAVPDELLELTNLCGTKSFVEDRVAAYREAGVTILNVTPLGVDPVALVGELKELLA